MSRRFTLLSLLFLASFLLFSTSVSAQIYIWPGDINNNNVVNAKDVLRWGYAYGATGPVRFDDGSEWRQINMSSGWAQNFPGETNFAFADCDGNGQVSNNDVRNVLTQHFGKTHGAVQPDYCPIGAKGAVPELKLAAEQLSYPAGARIDLTLSLGNNSRPALDFYGVALRIKYNRNMVKPGAVTFTATENGWFDPGGTISYPFFYNEQNSGFVEIAVVRRNQKGITGFGQLGKLTLILRGNTELVLPGALNLEVDLVQMINSKMEILPVYYEEGVTIGISEDDIVTSCPDVVEPVCGSDGNTYLNSCYAEAAGITQYTLGTCYGDCIDPSLMQPISACTTVVEPVCGCNDITYTNPCLAEAAGVTSYRSGPCNASVNERDCYDPILVIQSSGTQVDDDSGLISINCPEEEEPVCGCNGITYKNPCIAEASGIAFYTPGTCDQVCIDPEEMDLDADCINENEPVCGCNGITYSSPCAAEAAGLLTYSPGACGESSPWCAEAIPIQCGDFLAQETNEGAGNEITQFPGCSSQDFLGADRVYVFDKTTPGDLQIGLEILTPGVDLDLFLLKGTCGEVACIKSSKTNNQNTNNEGIILEDAPLGTYYIVVDAQFADAIGRFRLELNCGYLYCGDAIELACGEPFKYNNNFGEDDVSLYTCGNNVFNVENNGPEVTHYFTTTTASDVEISLSGLSANLELFLLGDCDRGACFKYSENPGTANESITAFLEPGTYYVVVDGRNGATSDYTLQVDCSNTCNFEITSITSTPSTCGINNGSIVIVTSGGTPGYLGSYSGPTSGSFTTSSNAYTIDNLAPGTYNVSKVDAKGCSVEETITVQSTGNLKAVISSFDAACSQEGSLTIRIENGTRPFKVFLSGPENATIDNISQAVFRLQNLKTGTYSINIVDANGCSITEEATIKESANSFFFDLTPFPAECGQPGSARIVPRNGQGPYTIKLTGPLSGTTTRNGTAFTLVKLPGGTYELTLEDANSCTYTTTFTIGDTSLDINAKVENGICGQLGAITVQITSGAPEYTIKWSGPAEGSVTTTAETYVIDNLPDGNYQIEVIDSKLCTGFDVAELSGISDNLSTAIQAIEGECGANGSVFVEMDNGVAPFTISWEGPVIGTIDTDKFNYEIPDLPEGPYKVVITDNNDCSDEHAVFVNKQLEAAILLTGYDGSCGQDGSIGVAVDGQANYIITWDGPVTGTANISEKNYDITGLSSGDYQVAVTDANGCTAVAGVKINNAEGFLNFSSTITPVACTQNGIIDLSVAGGRPPYAIEWQGPVAGTGETNAAGSISLTDLPAGKYLIAAVDKNGCTGSSTVEVQAEGNNINITLDGKDPVCTQAGQIVVNISDGSPEYGISWEGPVNGVSATAAASFSIVDLPAGTYKVTVTDKLGCQAVDNVTLVPSGALNITTTVLNASCGDGDLEIAIEQGTPGFDIKWDGPVKGTGNTNFSTYRISNLPDGTYRISVSDINGCTDEAEVKIFSGSSPEIIATPQPGLCGERGMIGISISGGAPAFFLTWAGPNNGNATVTGNYHDIDNLPSGDYTIFISDAFGCVDEKKVSILNETTDLALDLSLKQNDCGQSNIILANISGGLSTYALKWAGPQSGSATELTANYEIKDLPAGDYSFELTDAKGCVATSTITVFPDPTDRLLVTAVRGGCGQAGYIKVDIFEGAPPYTISWTGLTTGTATITTNTYELKDLLAGDYSVRMVDASGCSETINVTLEVPLSDLEVTLSVITNECGQNNTISVDIEGGVPPYTVTGAGEIRTVSGQNYNLKDLVAGDYLIEVSDSRGCTVDGTIQVEEAPVELLDLSAVNGNCGLDGQIKVSITGGSPVYNLSWSGPENGQATTTALTYTVSDLPSGDYSVTLTDSSGCMDIEQVSIQNTSSISAKITGIDSVCDIEPAINVVIESGAPGFEISWNGPTTGKMTTTKLVNTITNLTKGTYFVDIIDARGCEISEAVTLKNTDGNLKMETTVQNGICGAEGTIALAFSGGLSDYSVRWSGPESGTITTAQSSMLLETLPSGEYTIVVTDKNGCEAITKVVVANQEDLNAAVTIINGPCDPMGSILVDIQGKAPYTLSWTGPSSGSLGVNADFYAIRDLASGIYQVKVTDTNGCEFTQNIRIQNLVGVDAILTTTPATCGQLGSLKIDITGGEPNYTIKWSSPSGQDSATITGQTYTITDIPADTYSILVTDANGCSDIEQANLQSSEALSADVIGVDGLCDINPSITVNIKNGAADFIINWTGPTTGFVTTSNLTYTIADLVAGDYTIDITDAFGCKLSKKLTLQQSTGDLNIEAIGQDGACGELGNITLSFEGGNPDYVVTWTGPKPGTTIATQTNMVLESLPSGTYQLTIVDGNGCEANTTVTIANQANVAAELITTNGDCVTLGSIQLKMTGLPPYKIVWTGASNGSLNVSDDLYTIPNLASGTYTVQVTDANNCVFTEQVQIQNKVNDLDITLTPSTGFCKQAGSIKIDITGGTPGYVIKWDSPQESGSTSIANNSFTLSEVPSGQYSIAVRDISGCELVKLITLEETINNLNVEAKGQNGLCGVLGSIALTFSGGNPAYSVSWTGPKPGTTTTAQSGIVLDDFPSGIYNFTVVDNNGCEATTTVTIANQANLEAAAIGVDGACGTLGSIEVKMDGRPPYQIVWTGASNGSLNVSDDFHTISNLASGSYDIQITDANSCEITTKVQIQNIINDLDFILTPTSGACEQAGSITIDISGGTPDYVIKWSSPQEVGSTSIANKSFTLAEVPGGVYSISVTDANGCELVKEVNLQTTINSLKVEAKGDDGTCGVLGSIALNFSGGAPAYSVTWTGPKPGTTTTTQATLLLEELPSGNYDLTIVDKNGCEAKVTVAIANQANLKAEANGTSGACGALGGIQLQMDGSPPYRIRWIGPGNNNGLVSLSNPTYTIPNLASGSYDVTITDATSCTFTKKVQVQNVVNDLDFKLTASPGTCNQAGSIKIDISGGTPNYEIKWDSPAEKGSTSSPNNSFTLAEVPGGQYTISITDANGCERVKLLSHNEINNDLKVDAKAQNGTCGEAGSISINLNGGVPNYTVNWTGPKPGGAISTQPNMLLEDLPSGSYTITVKDGNGCETSASVTLTNQADLKVETKEENGICGELGRIQLEMTGRAPYKVAWTGASNASLNVASDFYIIPNLVNGSYDVQVTDANNCIFTEQIQIVNAENTIVLTTTVVEPSCETKGAITVTVDGSAPDFIINWNGPASGSVTRGKGSYLIEQLDSGTYTIEVTDKLGCKKSTTLTLNNQGGEPNANFTHTSQILTTTFNHVGESGTYLWNFGDGSTSTEASPIYEFNEPGTFKVCLTYTNSCGTATSCSDVTVTVPDNLVILDVGEKSAASGSTVEIPVTIDKCSLLVSLAGSIEIADPAVAQITGIVPGLIMPQYNGQNRTFIYFHNGGQGITLNPKDTLFYIQLQVVGAPGTSTSLRLTDTPLKVEVGSLENGLAIIKPHLSLKGQLSVSDDYASIAGQVSTRQGEPIPNTLIQVTGAGVSSTQLTNAAGQFSLPDLEFGEEYTIKPGKDGFPFNGLSTYALFVGQRFILGMEPLQITSPYQVIAGDANCNNSFTTLDLFIIQQLIIGATNEFASCPSWVFIASDNQMPVDFDAYNVFPYKDAYQFTANKDTTVSFIGVKVGDILSDADPSAFTNGPQIEERNPVYIDFKVQNQQIKAGEELLLSLSSDAFADLVSYQFSLDFDHRALSFIDLVGGDREAFQSVVAGTQLADRGQLMLSWFSKEGFGIDANPDDQLIQIRWKALTDIEDLEALISIKNLPLRAEAHTSNGDGFKLRLDWIDNLTVESPILQVPFKLYQNVPNPAKKETTIYFDLPDASNGELVIQDNLGRIIQRHTGMYEAGNNQIVLPIDHLKGGVYFYTFKSGPYTASRSMIVLN